MCKVHKIANQVYQYLLIFQKKQTHEYDIQNSNIHVSISKPESLQDFFKTISSPGWNLNVLSSEVKTVTKILLSMDLLQS